MIGLDGCKPRSDSSASNLMASDSKRVSLVNVGKYIGQTKLDGRGEKCGVTVHERKGIDFSFLGQGGIKSLTLSLSDNLLVKDRFKLDCFNGIASTPFCKAEIDNYSVSVSYQADEITAGPSVSIAGPDSTGEVKKLASCWRLTKREDL